MYGRCTQFKMYRCCNVCINLIDYGLDKDSCLQDSLDIDTQQAGFHQMRTKYSKLMEAAALLRIGSDSDHLN